MKGKTFTGGVRIGESYWQAANYSWPLATLTVLQDKLVLKMPFKELVLNREQIISISPYRGVINDGLQIEHCSQNTPGFVVFWTVPSKVAGELLSLGYSYQETNDQASPNPVRQKPGVLATILLLVIVFIAILIHEWNLPRGLPDALLNATGLTSFLAVIVLAVRWRVFR